MITTAQAAASILTRTCGYLETVCSHSLQPYRGCPFGKSLCGVGCYVQHSTHLTAGRSWGSFLDVKSNAADLYRRDHLRERNWARARRNGFVIFLSSATEPFPPQEKRFGITRSVLEAMLDAPPDGLILQTHSHSILAVLPILESLSSRTALRVHISIETDLDQLPGLPPHASSVESRFSAAETLKRAGLNVVVTVSPLLPIANPHRFFERIAACADAVVLDHFIEGDGSRNGSRTRRTPLPPAMESVDPESTSLEYRHKMGEIAQQYLPGRVGFSIAGFAGRWSSVGVGQA
jgi:DNA repair photolyase